MDLNLLGIGPLELAFVFILLLLLFGPRDIARMARDAGRLINRFTRSENYQAIQQASRELRNLPERLVQEAQLDEVQRELKATGASLAPTTRPPARTAEAQPPTTPAPAKPAAEPSAPPPDAEAFRAWTQELPSADPAASSPAGPPAPPSDRSAGQ
jgi:Sec-independent protein translocase protein TatA